MESILARALEYTLKYWLKSFSRDQFKLNGRTVLLSNLDMNGDALHASVGLPPALNVATAKIGKLEITLPSVSNVQVEPIVVQIDRLDLVLEEKMDSDACRSSANSQAVASSSKGNGYGFADKIADGMTIEVGTVNLMIETHGGGRAQGGATWASPLASITMRKLLLYTTNEQWQVVNLKEARDFSNGKKNIYVFKKLEWESLSIDLLPHPDMFLDASLTCSDNGANRRDDDGAKRVFFGGERFLEGISGEAYITIQRTELNSPLGLEVQLHVPEAVCPALSEPGLRALLRFMTGLYVCLNRGDVDARASQQSTEAAGRSLVSIIVDHIFLCIKDAEFQLELLMQSLFFSRASVSDGENTKNLSRITLGGLFLRDTFSHPPCTLVQPSMHATTKDPPDVPEFAGMNFCPPIYPLGDQKWQLIEGVPLLCLYSLQMKPSPAPPFFASQTVIDCQPLMINLQEESCLRITSFLADGIVVNPGSVLPDFSINSLTFSLKELDLTVPLEPGKFDSGVVGNNQAVQNSFAGARLHVENLIFSESPAVKLPLLNLEKDPACFLLWEGQPIDASQRKYTIQSLHLSLSLETYHGLESQHRFPDWSTGLWRCVELHHISVEAAMVTADGAPLKRIPPPGGVVRIGVACKEYLSNTSVEQLFFVLDLYVYLGSVCEKIAKVGKSNKQKRNEEKSLSGGLIDKVPSDTAVILNLKDLQLRFLESSFMDSEGITLVQFGGQDMFVRVSHRTLGGAIAVSSSIHWESVQLDCVDDGKMDFKNLVEDVPTENVPAVVGNGHPLMRAVFWIDNTGRNYQNGAPLPVPFLEINVVHVMPFDAQDMECHSLSVSAKVAGVRLGGGMKYTEALLHRFGILGPDGGPGKELSKGLKNLSAGPLSKLLRQSPLTQDGSENGDFEDGESGGFLELGKPEDVDVSIELNNWLFALEGEQEMAERWWFGDEKISREERCWHTMFQSLKVKGKSSPKHVSNGGGHCLQNLKYPIELITVGVEGLQALKPLSRKNGLRIVNKQEKTKNPVENSGGINLEAHLVVSNDDETAETPNWAIENLKFSVAQPIEAVATKEELQHLAGLCKSEVDSMGRITAGILKLLKLDATIGQATIDQLSNLGSESLGKIFTSEKLSRQNSGSNMASTTSSDAIKESPLHNVESTLASLESAISDSHAKCSALIAEVGSLDHPEKQQPLADMKELSQKIESMQILLRQLRTQI
ncbi:hypothetical protein Syun_010223 [Stephania yunnanensis]|uniref:Chorein N-terminal domain-containing protein n=1 Tax=Stephania yunnanensis TaxID=152371 RepID=A0AAP0PRF6_9MAGN